ncbi:MAG: ComF family protein [Alphaproteobacteria bacterium]|nr:ComF family protein [Alphaproteobacteria bacterium]MBV9694263.1 ComF family protein [Alphaproteobacteria bacterium]
MGTILQSGLRHAGRSVLDFLFPPLCIGCRTIVSEAGSLCPSCWQQVAFLDGPCCACCGLPFELDPGPGTRCAGCVARPPAFDRARAVMRYDEHSRAPILALKHADRLDLVPGFARWLARSGAGLLDEIDVIAAVPLHRTRLFRRRYNQSAELARQLGRLCAKPVAALLLERTRPTPSQGDMPSAKARRRNMRGAFRVPPQARAALKGCCVLLIDDVFTTGATVEACARALKHAGAGKVHVLALARVVRPGPAAI